MTTIDATLAAMGLPKHPAPHEIAKTLREAASVLEKHGTDAVDMATTLAHRGYPASTLGDGGSRGTGGLTSTESAVFGAMPDDDEPHRLPRQPHADADREYAALLRKVWQLASSVAARTSDLVRHAQDIDPTPSGTGECLACGRFCRPDKDRPGNRLVSGLCPTDYRAWARAGRPLRAEWIRTRRASFTDPEGVLHTPEPDHDLDLSAELQPESC